MRTPAEHKVFQWICWEKKYGKPVFKIFGTVGVIDSIRVTLVMSFWSTLIASMLGIFLGLVLSRRNFQEKAGSPREPDLDGSNPPVVIGLITYMIFEKKGPFGALRWVFTIKGMVTAQVLIITRSSVEWYIHMRSARRLRSGRLPGRWELTGIRPRGFCCVK